MRATHRVARRNFSDEILQRVSLRGICLEAEVDQHYRISDYLTTGRWFREADQGELVAVISMYEQVQEGFTHISASGWPIRILIPYIYHNAAGHLSFDYSRAKHVELRIIGVVAVPSRMARFYDFNSPDMDVEIVMEELYIRTNDIFLPFDTWQVLWDSNSEVDYQAQQIDIVADNMSNLRDIVSGIRRAYPMFTVFSVIDKANRILGNALLETVSENPLLVDALERDTSIGLIQEDLRIPIMLALLAVSALVIASHLMIIATERKTEIAVLKAVGSLRRDVVLMVLAEAVCITTISSLIGYNTIRFALTLNQVTRDNLGLTRIIIDMLPEMGLVLSIGIAASLLFAVIPALLTSKLSVMEVFRND
jgi:ABC-type antimicrobial peptide transport system permease subunit